MVRPLRKLVPRLLLSSWSIRFWLESACVKRCKLNLRSRVASWRFWMRCVSCDLQARRSILPWTWPATASYRAKMHLCGLTQRHCPNCCTDKWHPMHRAPYWPRALPQARGRQLERSSLQPLTRKPVLHAARRLFWCGEKQGRKIFAGCTLWLRFSRNAAGSRAMPL